MSNMYGKVGLYKHNYDVYLKVKKAFDDGEKVVGIIHATGLGKTYIALEVASDYVDKKILYVVPNNSIIEYIESVILENPNLSRDVNFKNMVFRTYQSFVNMSRDEISELDCDLLILDEFHHIGAPVWEDRIDTLKDTHPNMLVLGMTAYTVRERGTPYERDMANPDANELFSRKIVSRYDLVDAILDGVLPRDIIYRSGYTNLTGLGEELEKRIMTMNATKSELEEYRKILESVKKRINDSLGVSDVLKRYVKPNGKYFYFCPTKSEEGTNDIVTIMRDVYNLFSQYIPPEDIVFYVSTSEMKNQGKINREMFYNDMTLDGKSASGKLRIMFAINQYNEGVHAPNVDGVIMARGTTSDIVFFEQLGRALSVKGDTLDKHKEYEKYTYAELLAMAKDKKLVISEEMTREDIIEKLMSPVIIDLTNNIEFIKELEDNLTGRVKERRKKTLVGRDVPSIKKVSFDIELANEELFDVLADLRERVRKMTWDDWYELAKKYYEHYHDLNIRQKFKTNDGYTYDENGYKLGSWINYQRKLFKNNNLESERYERLLLIGMVFDTKPIVVRRDHAWDEMYKLAKAYYEKFGNLKVKSDFVTLNGYEYDENGYKLYSWIYRQKQAYKNNKLSLEQIEKLKAIGIAFEKKSESSNIFNWNDLAVVIYEIYQKSKIHDFNIPHSIGVKNGECLYGRLYLEKIAWIEFKSKNNPIFKHLFCRMLRSAYRINRDVVDYLDEDNMHSRLEFVFKNEFSLFNDSGKLHEVFYMDNASIKEKYGVDFDAIKNKQDIGNIR